MLESTLHRKLFGYIGALIAIVVLTTVLTTIVLRNHEIAPYITDTIITYIYIANILIGIAAGILGLVLYRSIVEPTHKLIDYTALLSSGKGQSIEIDGPGEIGEAAKNLTTIAGSLISQKHTLEVLNNLALQLIATSDIKSVAATSISHFCSSTACYAGALYVTDPQKKNLQCVYSYRFNADDTASHTVDFGEGIIGRCAESGQSIEQHIQDNNELSLPGVPEHQNGHLIALPVEIRNNVIAVLLLTSPEPFGKEQLEIIDRSIPLIAISISNSRSYEENQNLSLKLSHKEEELHRKEKELDKSNRIKSEFLKSIPHELRTPLNSVIGYSAVLLNPDAEPVTVEQRKVLNKILKNGRYLLQLINDILDISKIDAGRMPLSVNTESVHNLAAQAVSVVEPLIADDDLQIEIDIDPNLKMVTTDSLKVRQILINLLNNALKYSDRGTIRLRACEQRGLIHFEVIDQGVGIAEENLEIIFEEFRQIDPSKTWKYKSTGLGLPISRRLARLLGGDLKVTSRLHEGSTFTLSFPPVLDAKQYSGNTSHRIAEDYTHPDIIEKVQTYANNKKKPLHILCIDDDPDAIDILKKFLVPVGYTITSAFSGEEGIQLARTMKPALITLDIVLPGKDGWEVLEELKQIPETRDIPVIIHSIIDNQPLALSLGAINVMSKPVDPKRMMSLIHLCCIQKDQYVLLVDDNREFIAVMKKIIEGEGYLVKIAENGKRALELINQTRPGIIFLDLVMPEMDGFAFIRKLKANESFRNIPVVILSGKELTDQEKKYLKSNIQHLIKKQDFSYESILDSIKRTLIPNQ